MWCNAAVRGLTGHQLATAWVKVLGLCSSVNNEVGLLEAVIILVVTVKFGWSTVEVLVQASEDINVVPKSEDSLQWPLPLPLPLSLLKLILILHSYKSIYTEFLGRWSGWSFKLVTSKLSFWLDVNDVMPFFLIWSQRFQMVIRYVFLTITFETGLLINVS